MQLGHLHFGFSHRRLAVKDTSRGEMKMGLGRGSGADVSTWVQVYLRPVMKAASFSTVCTLESNVTIAELLACETMTESTPTREDSFDCNPAAQPPHDIPSTVNRAVTGWRRRG